MKDYIIPDATNTSLHLMLDYIIPHATNTSLHHMLGTYNKWLWCTIFIVFTNSIKWPRVKLYTWCYNIDFVASNRYKYFIAIVVLLFVIKWVTHVIVVLQFIIKSNSRKLLSHQPTRLSRRERLLCPCCCTVGKTVPFRMAVGNVELIHEWFPKHLRMGTVRMK